MSLFVMFFIAAKHISLRDNKVYLSLFLSLSLSLLVFICLS